MPDELGNETAVEKLLREKKEREASGTSDPAAIEGAKGTLSSTSDPQGVNNGQTDAASQPNGESGGQTRGSDGSGPSKTIDSQKASEKLGDETARVTDGTADGERVRSRVTGLVPESNDVMLGDQSSRMKPGEKGPLEVDGSKSPHDATSEGGSRQAAALEQVGAAQNKAAEEKENPAYQAAAKARTI